MTKKCLHVCSIFIILMSGVMVGCIGGTSPKSAYYVLNAFQKPSVAQSHISESGLGVGPIKIPEFLNRPQIVTRQGKNMLEIDEFHRWGDSLENQIAGVIIENMSALLNTPNVTAYPWEKAFEPKYQLYIDFRRFEGKTSDSVTVEAVWRVVDTAGDKPLLSRRSSLTEPTNGEGYTAYVIALNRALDKLCQEIAGSIIKELP